MDKGITTYDGLGTWFETRKKAYSIHACRPHLGSKVYNFLEDSHHITDADKCFVLCGTIGEKWVINLKELQDTYTFDNGQPIQSEVLYKHLYKWVSGGNGVSTPILDWIKINTIQNESRKYWALTLPKCIKNYPVITAWGNILIANREGIGHGSSDYLVCPDKNGSPNLMNVWVVNGQIFPNTYILPDEDAANDNTDQKFFIPKSIILKNGEMMSDFT